MPDILRKFHKALLLSGKSGFRKGMAKGIAAAIEHRAIVQSIPMQVCIDIGANIGQFSLLVNALHPNCKIVAFEPLAKPAAKYGNFFANNAQITVNQFAIGQKEESLSMNVSNSIDSSSLLNISSAQTDLFPGTHKIATENINIAPLLTFVSEKDLVEPTFLKIDVQGFELEVLKGSETLLKNVNWIYVESSFIELYEDQPLAHEIIDYLRSLNFNLSGVYNINYDDKGRAVQADFLFQPK